MHNIIFEYKAPILLFFLLFFSKLDFAQNLPVGAKIVSALQVTKDLKKDFHAKGDGKTDDHDAFINAAKYINKVKRNVKLIIPEGRYIVGRQKKNIGKANYYHPVYEGESPMELDSIENVSIIGLKKVFIIYKDSLRFGTFGLTDGKIPEELDLFNPSSKKGVNKIADYSPTALIGDFIHLKNCINIEISNIDINGNSNKYILGGNWGLGKRPIELDNCYGIVLKNVKNATLKNLSIHHFGVDNILLDSDFANNDTTYPLLNNIVLLNIKSSFSGRNSISWVGGKNILISNSSFTNAGTGRIATAPAYGMDIEPEGNPKHVLCSNGYFINTIFKDNAGLGFTTGTSIDNPVDALGYGYSYNHYFKNCTVVGRYNSAIHNFINRVTFDGCKFYGNVLNYGSSIDETPPCVFKNCYFSDLYNGEIFKDRKLLNLVLSYKAIISNCVFEKYSSSSTVSYLIEKDPDSYDCTNENVKPIIENCAFYYFIQPTPTLLFASILKKIKLKNNRFYKSPSDKIQWYNITGCVPKVGEGCTDLGNGLNYLPLSEMEIKKMQKKITK